MRTTTRPPDRGRRLAFTMVELLMVVAMTGLLVTILMPSLQMARDEARSVACMMNQQNAGRGLCMQAASRGGRLAAAYLPTEDGRATWAGRLVEDEFTEADAVTCPEFDAGGLPGANPSPDAAEDGQVGEAPGARDTTPDRCAFTVNEAVCPRPRFRVGVDGAVRASRLVGMGEVESDVVLVTEFATDWRVLSPGDDTCRSYLPVHGLIGIGPMPSDRYDLNGVSWDDRPCFASGCYRRFRAANLVPEPVINQAKPPRLNLVGRNHGSTDDGGFRRTTFTYADGHSASLHIADTLDADSWGHQVYSVFGDRRIAR